MPFTSPTSVEELRVEIPRHRADVAVLDIEASCLEEVETAAPRVPTGVHRMHASRGRRRNVGGRSECRRQRHVPCLRYPGHCAIGRAQRSPRTGAGDGLAQNPFISRGRLAASLFITSSKNQKQPRRKLGESRRPCRRNPSCNLRDLCGCHSFFSVPLCLRGERVQRAHVPRIKAFPRLLYSSAMLQDTLEEGRVAADRALERLLPAATLHPISIHKAMRHSVFAGGKRLRPILCREAGRMVAGTLPCRHRRVGRRARNAAHLLAHP